MSVDRCKWMLGSHNFDARSDNLNLELMIVSDDADAGRQVRCSVQQRLARSTRVEPGKLLLDVGRDFTAWKRTQMIFRRVVVEGYRGWL